MILYDLKEIDGMDVLVERFKQYLLSIEADDMDAKIEAFKLLVKNKYTKNTIFDEIGDFYDSLYGNSHRWTAFARYIQTRYKVEEYKRILNIGCGKEANTSQELIKRGYDVVSIDPKVKEIEGLKVIKEYFDYLKTNVNSYDLLIGLEPCDATEHAIRSALNNDKDFAIALCYAPHNSIDGRVFDDYKMWHVYLQSISKEIVIDNVKILGKQMTIIKRI